MTREEVIARVKHQRDWANEVNRMLDVEAFDMAIKALEQEPCEDAVSRAEVKKIAKEIYLEVANMELDVKTISDCISYTSSKCREVLERKLQDLQSIKTQEPRWIPVTERLPEPNRLVLCHITTGATETYFLALWNDVLNAWEEGIGGCRLLENDLGYKVIAWIPLSQPYKAESEEK